MDNQKLKIVAIIPTFNESANIGRVIQDLRAKRMVNEIVVIDDGSNDSTVEIAKEAGATVVPLVTHLGYGAALQTGYMYAYNNHFDVVVQLDGDGQHDPEFVKSLIDCLITKQCDLVIGSRFLSEKHYQAPLMRRCGMRLFQWIIYLLIRKKITDPTSGFQALNQKVIHFFTKEAMYPSDYPDADMILLLHNVGFRIEEIPVIMHESQTGQSMHSGIRPLYYVVKMMLSIFSVLFGQYRTFLRKN